MQGVVGELSSGFFKMDKLNVKLPKFSVAGSLELNQPLRDLNISSVFGPTSNLTGFLAPNSGEEVKLDSALHKAFIEVSLH